MKKLRVIVGFIVLAVTTTLALAHSGAIGIVKERMDMFKKNQDNLKAIKSHIRSEDYESRGQEFESSQARHFPLDIFR